MRARPKKETRPLVETLLKTNPLVSYTRIGEAAGYTRQMVGVIAREMGLPPRDVSNTYDDVEIVWPPDVKFERKLPAWRLAMLENGLAKKPKEVAEALLLANPDVTYARIGREIGCRSQMVGNIAKKLGVAHRSRGGSKHYDPPELVWPPGLKVEEMETNGA